MSKLSKEIIAEIAALHFGPRKMSPYAIARDVLSRHKISVDRTTVLYHIKNSPEARHERGRVAATSSRSVIVGGERVREGKSYEEIEEASDWRRAERIATCEHGGEFMVIRKCLCCGKIVTTREHGCGL